MDYSDAARSLTREKGPPEQPGQRLANVLSGDRRKLISIYMAGVLAFAALTLLAGRYGLFSMLAIALLLGGLALMLVWPEAAILLVVLIIYSNIPGIAVQLYGVHEAIAGSFLALLAIPLIHNLITRREKLKIDSVLILMAVLLVVMLASSLFARDLLVAGKRIGTFVVEGLLLYFAMLNLIRTPETLRRVIWVVILGGALLGSLSLYQALTRSYDQQFGGFAQRQLRFEIADGAKAADAEVAGVKMARADRAEGPIGDPNIYAQIMLVLAPLAFFCFRGERSRLLRVCALGSLGLILCGVLLSYSRGAFLTLALLLFIMVFMRVIRVRHVLAGAFLLLIAVAVLAPAYYQRMSTILGVQGLFFEGAAVQPDAVTQSRTTEMLAALQAFVDHPLLGVGPGQYTPFYSGQYQLDPDIALRYINTTRRAHTLYFELAAETGILGLGVFMAIILVILHRLWKAYRQFAHRQPDLANLATTFLLSIVAYLGTAFFLSLAFERYLWLLLAMSSTATYIIQSEWLSREGVGEDSYPLEEETGGSSRLGS